MFSKFFSNKKTLWVIVVIIIALAIEGYYISHTLVADSEPTETPIMETARIRQGDIV